MDRYEYRVLQADIGQLKHEDFEEKLNAMGREGWNLITSVAHERHGYSHEVHFVFSRPITDTK